MKIHEILANNVGVTIVVRNGNAFKIIDEQLVLISEVEE